MRVHASKWRKWRQIPVARLNDEQRARVVFLSQCESISRELGIPVWRVIRRGIRWQRARAFDEKIREEKVKRLMRMRGES